MSTFTAAGICILHILDEKLARAGLTKAQLAERIGVNPTTVSRWGHDAPKYALAYLDLYLLIREAWDTAKRKE